VCESLCVRCWFNEGKIHTNIMHGTYSVEIIIQQMFVFKSNKKLILECRVIKTHVIAALHDNALSCVTNRNT